MTPLGKSLVFWLNYPAEMRRLYDKPVYDGEEPDLAGLEDADRVREMARAVGASAYAEAAGLLKECAKKIEDHFVRLTTVRLVKRARPSTILRNWEWHAGVELVPSAPGGWFVCGVSLRDQEKALVPWLWRHGGRAWEDLVMERLRGRVHSRAGGEVVSDSGSVALARIPVFGDKEPEDDVDRDPLVAKVVNAFSLIRTDDVQAIAHSVSEEVEGPESDEPLPGTE